MVDKKLFYKEYPNFDWLYYHKIQPQFNIEKDENKVIEHFLKIGKNKKVLYNKNNYYNNFELDNINIGEISKGFDWEYYLKINNDLNKLFETKLEAYNHYIKFGINEKRIKNILEKYEIKQLRTSDCMTHFKDRFKDFYKLKEYEDENINTVYFGVYSTTDINNIKNMKNTKYIIFGGTDVDLILSNKELKKLFDEIDNKIILYISNNINDRLKYYGYKDAIKFNLNLTDKNIFKKPESLGDSIFIYNGFSKGLEHLYGKDTYEEIIKRNPNFNYIFSNNLNVKNEEMYNIYKKCFIGLRLTVSDGNANMVKEMECMEIPVIHNHSNYGLKWKTVEDIENLIHKNMKIIDINGQIDFYNLKKITKENLNEINLNIDNFTNLINNYKNILFICSDIPGYGGAATNCKNLSLFYKKKNHNILSIYYQFENNLINTIKYKDEIYVNDKNLLYEIQKINFKPNLIILKNFVNIDLKKIFNCNVYYLIPGIFKNNLNKYYYNLENKNEVDKYFNKNVLNQIKMSDKIFCNSYHTKELLIKYYNIQSCIFYSSFINYYKQDIIEDINFEKRKYKYGLIISNFDREIKNIKTSIEFLKNKENVILIGKGSKQYESYGFTCIELIDNNLMADYYKNIKYIVQDSYYESCSNVKIEGLFNGCKLKQKYHEYNVVISSTQYPGYGGAATNAYQIIKFLRQNGVNTTGVFFHNCLDVNYDPEEIGGIFLYLSNKYEIEKVKSDILTYLKTKPNYCLAKNYVAPYICKKIFNCYTVYLVSGMNHFNLYPKISALELLDNNFIVDKIIKEEVETNKLSDSIIVNSKITYDVFNKIYPEYVYKLKQPLDTTICIKKIKQIFEKEFDIAIICSNFKRESKNNLFLIDVLQNEAFDNYKKMIIGENNDVFKNVKNTTLLPLQLHHNCIEYMAKSKILLHPALYESNSNTIREAYYHKCLPIITKNVGYNELFPDYLICDNFTIPEWIKKVKYALNNYDDIKNTVINFNTSLDINKLF